MRKFCPYLLVLPFLLFLTSIQAQNWQLVWSDEFTNGISGDWNFEVNGNGGGNNELQYYRAENASVENGSLVITAKQENYGGKNYTSARMTTQGKKSWRYGKIEARIAMPSFNGIWPAFWMLGDNIGSVGWPACGEIDIMEHVNGGNQIFGTIHWANLANTHAEWGGNTFANSALTNYHTYTIEWDANIIRWYVDGVFYHSADISNGVNGTNELHNNYFILLNLAVGGNWPGFNIDNGQMPAKMYVDYVRVYQDNPGPAPSTDVVTSWGDCNYSGFSGGLPVGTYTTAQLNAIGIANNSLSSVSVAEGYQVILYDGDNFTGNSMTITASNNCVGGFNDLTSSVIVKTNGATNMAGTYFIQNRNSGLYLDQWGALTTDGGNVAQANYNGNQNQQWQLVHVSDGAYQVIAKHSNKVLDIDAISKANGANAQQWTYFGSFNQQFIVVPSGGGFYKLIAKHSGKVVEVAGAGMNSGDNVQQWDNNGQTCGQWKFKPYTTPGTGTGLAANYFNGMNFENPVYSRVDANINFNWGTGTPNAAVNADQFSTRWTGQIQPLYTETYTFHLNSDNGRRLWVNNVLVIDQWLDNWGTEYTGTIALNAGQKYEIRLEYFENSGGANCKLEWSSFYQDRQVIPQSQLYANSLPTVSLTAPANNAQYTAPATIAITATAGDGDGSVAKVDFYNGATFLGSDNASPFTYNWTGVTRGTYTVTAVATDNRGGVTRSGAITVNVNQAPTVAITTPSNNATFVAPATINFTATAADADGTISKVEYFNGTTLIGTATASPYNFSWTNTGVGTYTVTAKATDNTGAVTTSAAITVMVNANQVPTVVITTPANNASFTAPATINIAATATDIDGTITKVEFFNGASLLGTDASAPYTFNWSGVAAGTYNLTAKATDDKSGVTTSTLVVVKVVNPNQLPAVVIDAPLNNATFVAPATVAITASATDTDGTITLVEFYNGTTLLGSDASAPYTFNWTGVVAGTYTLTAKATDNQAGVFTSASVTITVTVPNQLPTVTITSPANNASFTAPATVVITASASDGDGNVTQVEFYRGSTLIGTDYSAPYSFDWTPVAAGTYSLTAVATDNQYGSTTSAVVTIVVSNPVNQLPAVLITSPANNATFTAPAAVAITATATDVDGTIAKVEFYIDGSKVGESTGAPYSYTWISAPAGTYSLTAVATDNNGAVSTSAAVTIVVNPDQTTGVTQGNLSEDITLYPNPSSDIVFITSQMDLSGARIRVMNMVGIEVMGESTFASEWNVSALEAGVYTLIILKDGNVMIKKLVVE